MTLPAAAAIAERYGALRAEVGENVTIVVATKYVPLEEMGVLAEAGIEVVGENRAQDLARKHDRYADAFRWHFIGHLQSNKVKEVNSRCELVHSLDSDSSAQTPDGSRAARGRPRRGGVEVGSSGRGDCRLPGAAPARTRAHDDASARRRRRKLAPVLPAAPRARGRARSRGAEHGNVAGLPRRG